MAEVIRYGAGGVPYKGNIGPQSPDTQVASAPVEEEKVEPKLDMKFEEDDRSLTDEQVGKKTEGRK